MTDYENFIQFYRKCENIVLGQNLQDAWILFETKQKINGYFVDFGATDGKTINNTYILEKYYGWKGIVAEPNFLWHDGLQKNRTCNISLDCVWTTSDQELEFLLTDAPDLSTIKGFGTDDEHAYKRSSAQNISRVKTISLLDLLKKFDSPKTIDYLSIDTEGSEFQILSSFFENPLSANYTINHITVEHNYVNKIRENIFSLLSKNGYERKFSNISRCDDFYKKVDV